MIQHAIEGPSAWTRADISPDYYRVALNPACLDEIRNLRCDQVDEVPVSCEGVRLCR